MEGEGAEFFEASLYTGYVAGGDVALASVPRAVDGVVEIEAAHDIGEVAHEVAAAEFTVGEDVEA